MTRQIKTPVRLSAVVLASLLLCGSLAHSAEGGPSVEKKNAQAHIDHVILGAADLDQAVEAFERLTGVRPAYGGKHPRGTHNALVSLGGRTYLEIIAVQPGASKPPLLPDLSGFDKLAPIGWAVSADDGEALRKSLAAAGFQLSGSNEGSRTTPSGATLRWQTFGLTREFEEAPFFILWSPETPHPSTTSPSGCTLQRWAIAGPRFDETELLRKTLALPIEAAKGQTVSFTLALDCPKGRIVFEPATRR
ncbi:MAG TPA: VOC family protein [Thermoanaerobaculia bacterium]